MRWGAAVVTGVLWAGLVDGEAGHHRAALGGGHGGEPHPGGEVDHALIVVPGHISQLDSDHSEKGQKTTQIG